MEYGRAGAESGAPSGVLLDASASSEDFDTGEFMKFEKAIDTIGMLVSMWRIRVDIDTHQYSSAATWMLAGIYFVVALAVRYKPE